MIRCLVTLTCCLVVATADAQKFRSGVDLVRVDALVTADRKPVTGLSVADFELRDNGVPQTLTFASLESLPLSVVFALDTSGSVAGQRMRHLAQAVDVLLNGLRDQDRAALVTFSHRVWLRTPLVTEFSRIRAAIATAETVGGTSLYDAVYAALAIAEVQDARPLVVIFSDGLDNTSWLTADAVQSAARRGGAVVYSVAVGAREQPLFQTTISGTSVVTRPAGSRSEYVRGQTDFLDALASATGGRVLKADTTVNLPAAFEEVLREFRTRYVLTYSPHGVDAPGWHRIELRVKGRRVDIHARAGYQR
jgi:Ca-activated chloride channel family protein